MKNVGINVSINRGVFSDVAVTISKVRCLKFKMHLGWVRNVGVGPTNRDFHQETGVCVLCETKD